MGHGEKEKTNRLVEFGPTRIKFFREKIASARKGIIHYGFAPMGIREAMPYSGFTTSGRFAYGLRIPSFFMRARNVLRSRHRISAALFLPLTFQWVCLSTRTIYARSTS